MRKLNREETKIAKQCGEFGVCGICNRKGLKSMYHMWYKDKKLNRMFGSNGTHVMSGTAMYYPDGTRAQHPKNGYVETPSVCKTCDKKHFDMRYDDGHGNNPHGTPLTEIGKKLTTVDKEEWLKLCEKAEQKAIEYKQKHSNDWKNVDVDSLIKQIVRPY